MWPSVLIRDQLRFRLFVRMNDSASTMRIEKASERDQYFKGYGQTELIGGILEACLRQSR